MNENIPSMTHAISMVEPRTTLRQRLAIQWSNVHTKYYHFNQYELCTLVFFIFTWRSIYLGDLWKDHKNTLVRSFHFIFHLHYNQNWNFGFLLPIPEHISSSPVFTGFKLANCKFLCSILWTIVCLVFF
jgi:hypothetical protein